MRAGSQRQLRTTVDIRCTPLYQDDRAKCLIFQLNFKNFQSQLSRTIHEQIILYLTYIHTTILDITTIFIQNYLTCIHFEIERFNIQLPEQYIYDSFI